MAAFGPDGESAAATATAASSTPLPQPSQPPPSALQDIFAEAIRSAVSSALRSVTEELRLVRAVLSDAVPSTASVARSNATAFASVWFVESPVRCSAFEYVIPHAGATPVWLTAAHCFADRARAPNASFYDGLFEGLPITLRRLGDGRAYSCTVVLATPSPDDSAILHCPDAPHGVSLARASLPRSLTVTAIGFTEDAFPPPSPYHVSGESGAAVNVPIARSANVAGPVPQGGSCKPVSNASPTVKWPVTPEGFFDTLVEPGMSGGPLLDARGGVLGIIHGNACRSTAYISLDTVDAFLVSHGY